MNTVNMNSTIPTIHMILFALQKGRIVYIIVGNSKISIMPNNSCTRPPITGIVENAKKKEMDRPLILSSIGKMRQCS